MTFVFLSPVGKSKTGVKYKGTIEVPNLSDENDMEDLAVSLRLTGNFVLGVDGDFL